MTIWTAILWLLAGIGTGALIQMAVESIERTIVDTYRSRVIKQHTEFMQSLLKQGRFEDVFKVLQEIEQVVAETEEKWDAN